MTDKLFLLIDSVGNQKVEVTQGSKPEWKFPSNAVISDYAAASARFVTKLVGDLPHDWRQEIDLTAEQSKKVSVILAIENGIGSLPDWAQTVYTASALTADLAV